MRNYKIKGNALSVGLFRPLEMATIIILISREFSIPQWLLGIIYFLLAIIFIANIVRLITSKPVDIQPLLHILDGDKGDISKFEKRLNDLRESKKS